MNKEEIIKNFKEHLILAVGKKSSKCEMEKVKKHMSIVYKNLDSNKSLNVKRAYNHELAKIWPKIAANENKSIEILRFIKEIKLNEKSNLLSIASGLSVFEMFLAKYYLSKGKVYCTDFCSEMNKKGREIAKKLKIRNIKFILASADNIPLKNKSQDIILARRTGLSYGRDWKKVLVEVRRLLNDSSSSRFVYSVKASLLGSLKKVKKELGAANLEFILSYSFKESDGTKIAVVVAR